MIKKFFIALCVLLPTTVMAIDTLEFSTDEQRLQFLRLAEELRCPKCQNQNIADSNAPIAKDLRNELHRMILEGKDEEQVVDFMVERYGNFVVYKPKFDTSTYLLWLGPAVIALLGVVIVVMTSRKKRSAGPAKTAELSQEDKNQLSKILSEDEK